MTVRILHVLDHSIPMQSGYTFRTRSILREQRRMGWETVPRDQPEAYGVERAGGGCRRIAVLSDDAVPRIG